MTSPVILKDCTAVIKARVPLENKEMYLHPKVITQLLFELLVKWPAIGQLLAVLDLLQIGDKLFKRRQQQQLRHINWRRLSVGFFYLRLIRLDDAIHILFLNFE
jgi:hypothetical protein